MSEAQTKPVEIPGTIGWNEVITPNKEESIAFYTQLFGWTTENMELPGGMTYTMFKQGDRPVAGCVQPDQEGVPASWLQYVSVEDLDETIQKAKSLGASIIMERVDLPMGSFAVVADPQGATFAFWQSTGDCPS
ncbi:VOC family protein [Cerasicoccus maritimus]|uniref:VOC family protein n=1 Tax=Cerasicoccus maritimus TaxID=490089 RepID=UPI0028527661|nr:VOC family protein [Cerasicoccus maritimus]